MRLDKYLKVSRLIKRRTIAKEMADNQRISINDKPAKSSSNVQVNDILSIRYGNKIIRVEILGVEEVKLKNEAKDLYRLIDEEHLPQE